VILPNETVNAAAAAPTATTFDSHRQQRKFTIDDLNDQTVALINAFYKQDFERLGYEMMTESSKES